MTKIEKYEQSEEILNKMNKYNIIPNLITFNILMTKIEKYEQSEEILNKMNKYNIIPNTLMTI
jgi:hypothetical protein